MKKFLKYFLLTILAIVILSFFFDLNSAHIENVQMCTQLANSECNMDKPVFDVNTPQIVISCSLENPPMDTRVQFSWFYTGNGRHEIDNVEVTNGDEIGKVNMNSTLGKPTNGWPIGDYEVVIKILETEKDSIVKRFWVK